MAVDVLVVLIPRDLSENDLLVLMVSTYYQPVYLPLEKSLTIILSNQ